jgi:hypothetical protein
MAATEEKNGGVVMEDVAVALCREVQRSFAGLLSRLPGQIVRASHLQHCLDLDAKLAWQFFKVAKATDPLEAVRHMPSVVAVRRIAKAAASKGVPADVIEAVSKAVTHFDEVGKRHADGRESFAAMVASIRGENAAETLTMQARRAAFRANSQLWGAQVGVLFYQCFLRRQASGELKATVVSGKFDYRKLRADAMPLMYGRSGAVPGPEGEIPACKDLPIDVDSFNRYGIPVLPEFCSKPVPRFSEPSIQNGWHLQTMLGDQLGKLGSIDLVTAAYKSHQLTELTDGRKVTFAWFASHVPMEIAVIELLTHRPSFGEVKPTFRVMPEFIQELEPELEREGSQLPCFEQVQHLGNFRTAPPASEVRDYAKMGTRVLGHVKWAEEEFDVHRVVVGYPMIHTIMGMGFEVEG